MCTDGGAVLVCDVENRAGEGRFVGALLEDGEGAVPLVPEDQLLLLAALDEDVLGRTVQNEPIYSLDLPRHNGGAGFQAVHDDLPCMVRVENSVIRSDCRAGTVHQLEGHAGERFIFGALNELTNDEGGGGLVVENQRVGDTSPHYDALRL